uniref:Uncharacterized protein n=1 Tax=Cajanus cajan TaxID=3821 RepID=A0A151U7T2_CAJCA|nr:hypothetical protein KK1_008102 [Cajanus cajan]
MQERRALGLCYNCDEKFMPGHKCATSRFLLLLCDDEIELVVSNVETLDSDFPLDSGMGSHFHLSTFALTRQPSTQTFKF